MEEADKGNPVSQMFLHKLVYLIGVHCLSVMDLVYRADDRTCGLPTDGQ